MVSEIRGLFHRNVEDGRGGKSLSARGALAFKVNDQGVFSKSWFLYNDQQAFDRFSR